MISRRSTKRLADLCLRTFRNRQSSTTTPYWIPSDPVYDFLFERDFDLAFCNAANHTAYNGMCSFEEFILRLHTGESVSSFKSAPLSAASEGQGYLRQLSQQMLLPAPTMRPAGMSQQTYDALTRESVRAIEECRQTLVRSLELDGYVLRNGRLLHLESAIVDIDKQHGVLVEIAREVALANVDVLEHHFDASEEHFTEGRWDDCIAQARKFMECCHREGAVRWSQHFLSKPLEAHVYERAQEAYSFLRKHGLLSQEEFDVVRETYSFLSAAGGHPYIANNDQARMLRQVALIYAECVLLRLKGRLPTGNEASS